MAGRRVDHVVVPALPRAVVVDLRSAEDAKVAPVSALSLRQKFA